MRIYLFNPVNGFYLGENIVDEVLVENGAVLIPPDATTIAPPEAGRGFILVFDVVAKSWKVRSHWKQEDLDESSLEISPEYGCDICVVLKNVLIRLVEVFMPSLVPSLYRKEWSLDKRKAHTDVRKQFILI
jgi:hypothetical protein